MALNLAGDNSLRELENALAQERDALITGDLTRLSQLSDRRERAMSRLSVKGQDTARLAELRALAARNVELALAARKGVQAALERVTAIRAASGPIGSYGADGRPASIGNARPNFERKA